MARGKTTWTVVLRCHECSGRFVVNRVPLDQIAYIPQVTPCTHCAAKSIVADARAPETSRLHRILDLREEKDR